MTILLSIVSWIDIRDDELKKINTIYDEFLRHITMIVDRRQNELK